MSIQQRKLSVLPTHKNGFVFAKEIGLCILPAYSTEHTMSSVESSEILPTSTEAEQTSRVDAVVEDEIARLTAKVAEMEAQVNKWNMPSYTWKTDDMKSDETDGNKMIAVRILEAIRTSPDTQKTLRNIYACRKVFPPKKNINKFMVGGINEESIVRLIRKCGWECANVSSTENVVDLTVKEGDQSHSFSLKTVQKFGSAIILENYRGQQREVSTLAPTFILVLEERLATFAYVDQSVLDALGATREEVYTHSDSNLSMRGAFAKNLIKRHLDRNLVIELEVPALPDNLVERDVSILGLDYVESLLS